MSKRCCIIGRRMAVAGTAGVLLQTGGCMIDPNVLLQDLVTSAAINLLASYVFGFFNVPLGF